MFVAVYTLNNIVKEVLQGNSKAAFSLPDRYLIQLHILLSKKLARLSNKDYRHAFKPLFKYFQGMKRYQIGIMWRILAELISRDRLQLWYYEGHAKPYYGDHALLICNALFVCSRFTKNHNYVIMQTEAERWSKKMSLYDVIYGEVKNDTYVTPQPQDHPEFFK